MRSEFLPFSRPALGDRELEAVARVLRSGWLTSGPEVRAFEDELARRIGAEHAVALSSATAGFQLLFAALGIGPGDEVITPSLTWPAVVNMIELAGARPVFAEIDPRTLQLDPGSVAAAAGGRTRAVVPVHFAGAPCDLEPLRALCARQGAALLEDAAHALGAEHQGSAVGGGEATAVFSFHPTKNVTCGEGGMVTTGDDDLAARLRALRFHGLDRDAEGRHGRAAGYDVREPGWKLNLTDIQAALGRAQLERLDAAIERREELARLYDGHLAEIPELSRPVSAPGNSRHARHIYPVLVDRGAGLSRDELREELLRRQIGTGLHYPAVHTLSFYRRRYPDVRLHATEDIADRILSLPLFPGMDERDVGDVVEALREALGRACGSRGL